MLFSLEMNFFFAVVLISFYLLYPLVNYDVCWVGMFVYMLSLLFLPFCYHSFGINLGPQLRTRGHLYMVSAVSSMPRVQKNFFITSLCISCFMILIFWRIFFILKNFTNDIFIACHWHFAIILHSTNKHMYYIW